MNDQERLDDLIIDGLQIYQRSDMFRFSFDAIALIHFCLFNGRHTYVDLGTGNGCYATHWYVIRSGAI